MLMYMHLYLIFQQSQIRGVAPIQGQQPGMLPISLQQDIPGRVSYLPLC